jgi:hypothetical protein
MFFKAKNMKYKEDPAVAQRCLAMMIANLGGLAAAWCRERVEATNAVPESQNEFEKKLRKEFEPFDLQARLRDQLHGLQQKNSSDQMNYVGRYRNNALKFVK